VTILRLPDHTPVGKGEVRVVRNSFSGYDELYVILNEWTGGPSQVPGYRPTYFALRLDDEALLIPRGFFTPPIVPPRFPPSFRFKRVPPLGYLPA
jgi:hypothetical protein